MQMADVFMQHIDHLQMAGGLVIDLPLLLSDLLLLLIDLLLLLIDLLPLLSDQLLELLMVNMSCQLSGSIDTGLLSDDHMALLSDHPLELLMLSLPLLSLLSSSIDAGLILMLSGSIETGSNASCDRIDTGL